MRYKDKSWLKQKYEKEKLSTRQIAVICKTGKSTIEFWLHKFNLKVRRSSRADINLLLAKKTWRNKVWLEKQYLKSDSVKIAKACNITPMSIRKWMKKFGIKARYGKGDINNIWQVYGGKKPFTAKQGNNFYHTEETKEKLSKINMGKNNPQWRGGISFEPYNENFNYELKKQIWKRDNFRCQFPNCENKKIRLDTHHINYDKTDNRPEILITLCISCHAKTGFNREYWQNYFTQLLKIKETKLIEKKECAASEETAQVLPREGSRLKQPQGNIA